MKPKLPEGNMELIWELNKTREMLSNFFNARQKYWGTPFISAICRLMGDIDTLKRIVEKNK